MRNKDLSSLPFLTARQDVPERFSSLADPFTKRTGSGPGHGGEYTKHRTLLDSLLAPKAVRVFKSTFYLSTPSSFFFVDVL